MIRHSTGRNAVFLPHGHGEIKWDGGYGKLICLDLSKTCYKHSISAILSSLTKGVLTENIIGNALHLIC